MSVAERQQAVVSYGILAALIVIAVMIGIAPPLQQRVAHLDSIERAQDILVRSEQAIANAERLAANRIAEIDPGLLFAAETDALAAADLQQTITAIVERQDASLVSTAFRRSDEDSPLTPVPVAVRLRSSVASLTEILLALEAEEPRLYVANLSVQSRHRPGRALQSLAEELDVQFDVVGYLLPPEASL